MKQSNRMTQPSSTVVVSTGAISTNISNLIRSNQINPDDINLLITQLSTAIASRDSQQITKAEALILTIATKLAKSHLST